MAKSATKLLPWWATAFSAAIGVALGKDTLRVSTEDSNEG